MAQNGTVSEQSGKILEIIKREGGWVKRKAIASALGKKTLDAGDLVLLQYLIDQGLIEVASVQTNAPSKTRVEYKAV